MKKKLLYLIIPMLFSAVSVNAQIKVWDFGGETVANFGSYTFENMLTPTAMNAWSASPAGTAGVNLPNAIAITPGLLRWTGGTNSDRLRVSDMSITRWDESVHALVEANYTFLTGRMYVNSAAKADRGLHVTLAAGQEITVLVRADAAGGTLNFSGGSGANQTEALTDAIKECHFTATTAGEYKLYDSLGKPSFYRLYLGNVTTPTLGTSNFQKESDVTVYNKGGKIFLSNVKSSTSVAVYSVTGSLVQSIKTSEDTSFDSNSGIYVVKVQSAEGTKSVKVIVQ